MQRTPPRDPDAVRARMGRPLLALAFVCALVVGAGAAAAHENQRVEDARRPIDPGAGVDLPARLHYHRLVGVVSVASAEPDAALVVRVLGPRGEAFSAGPARELRLNELIACCDGDTWAPHVVRVENAGPRPLLADVRLVLLHDGLAVSAHDAEDGAAASLAAWALAAVISLVAMRRYGGSPAEGLMAIAADLPWLGNAFITTGDLFILLLVALWATSMGAWAAAARRAPAARATLALAALLAGGAVAAAATWAVGYDAWLVPLMSGAAAAGLPAGWAIPRVLRWLAPRAAPVPPDEAAA